MSSAPKSLEAESATYRSVAPRMLRLRLADIEDLLPRDLLLRPIAADEMVELPASHIFAHIVPTLSLGLLAELRPDLIGPARGVVRLPAHRVAKNYGLLETRDFQPSERDDFLFRGEIPSPAAHLGKILAGPVQPEVEIEEPSAPVEVPAEAESEPPPRRLAEIISNLPTFQRVTETTFLTLKPLAPKPMQASAEAEQEIPNQHALQALLMTDETLNTGRIVELCGSLPGIQSCVLTSGNRVLASHNTPEGLDIVSLSFNATAVLQAVQDASVSMGAEEIPAVTLHTARGPLSILQKEHLAMLVFHGDRGFVPGVREKLTTVLGELTHTPLALPAPSPEG